MTAGTSKRFHPKGPMISFHTTYSFKVDKSFLGRSCDFKISPSPPVELKAPESPKNALKLLKQRRPKTRMVFNQYYSCGDGIKEFDPDPEYKSKVKSYKNQMTYKQKRFHPDEFVNHFGGVSGT